MPITDEFVAQYEEAYNVRFQAAPFFSEPASLIMFPPSSIWPHEDIE